MNESNISDDALAELLTLTMEVTSNGTSIYRNQQGRFHRIHGPAVVFRNGTHWWFMDGDELTEEQFHERTKSIR